MPNFRFLIPPHSELRSESKICKGKPSLAKEFKKIKKKERGAKKKEKTEAKSLKIRTIQTK